MFNFLKKIFARDKGLENQAFREKYRHFRELLDRNNEVLETLSDLADLRDGRKPITLGRLRSMLTRTAVDVYRLVQNLNFITDNDHLVLNDIFGELEEKLIGRLEVPSRPQSGVWYLPLEEVGRELASEVGTKAANLGEIVKSRAAAVPRGAAFTAYAYYRFLEHNHLQDRINKEELSIDPEDHGSIEEASRRIGEIITTSDLPPELEEALGEAYRNLTADRQGEPPVILRSSAVGEDELGRSFAGLFSSIVNPGPEGLAAAYKEVVASKYSPRAITYCLQKGVYEEFFPICVLLMELVPAEAAGVMYSRDPTGPDEDILISAVWGLGKQAVDGSGDPDRYRVSRADPGRVRDRAIGRKDFRLAAYPGEGVRSAQVGEDRRDAPCLSDDRIVELAAVSLKLEGLFGQFMDTEWALDREGLMYVVQSRPLSVEPSVPTWRGLSPSDELDRNYRPLAEGLRTASPGVAWGRSLVLDSLSDMTRIEPETVLVVREATPKLVSVFPKTAALLSETGSGIGHLAIIAREFRVPMLIGLTGETRESLRAGREVTVDAYTGRVYEGRVAPLLDMAAAMKDELKEEPSPARLLLEDVLSHVIPLNLVDPRSPSFRAQSVRTIHDIIRFAHETAINAMFEINDSRHLSRGPVRRLASDVPLDVYMIDIGRGLSDNVTGKKVRPDDVTSIPMRALYRGMTTRGVRWSGHVPIDFKGFISVFANTMYDASKYERRLGDRSYAIVSNHYLNFSSRLGYHFSIVDAYTGPAENDNYLSFRFKGGAASLDKRERRVRFIEEVLERYGFWVDRKADLINARVKRLPQPDMEDKLVMLGRLMGCSRQLDVTMNSEAKVDEYVERFMAGDYSMGHEDEGGGGR